MVMAKLVTGFNGSVDHIEDAIRSPFQGSILPVVRDESHLAVTPNIAGTRSANIASGVAWAHGVRALFDPTSLTFDPVTTVGQSRWDAVIIRRDWTAATAELTRVNGVAAVNAAMVAPAGLASTPGDRHDQIIALVQVTYNVGTVVVEDRRIRAYKTLWVPSLAALPAADRSYFGMEVLVGAAGARYRCSLNSVRNPTWIPEASGWQWAAQSEVLASGPGFTGSGMNIRGGLNPVTGDVQLDVRLRRTGASITPSTTGNFSPDIALATMNARYWPDRPIPLSGQYRVASGAWYQFDGLYGTDGLLAIHSGTPGAPLANWPASNPPSGNDVSVRAHLRLTREV